MCSWGSSNYELSLLEPKTQWLHQIRQKEKLAISHPTKDIKQFKQQLLKHNNFPQFSSFQMYVANLL